MEAHNYFVLDFGGYSQGREASFMTKPLTVLTPKLMLSFEVQRIVSGGIISNNLRVGFI